MAERMRYKELEDVIGNFLALDSHIAGVLLIKDRVAYENLELNKARQRLYYCYMIKMAVSGMGCKAELNNFSCEASAKILGLEDYYEPEEGVAGWMESGLYASREYAEIQHRAMEPSGEKAVGVAVAPLSEFKSDPDVVMIACTPYQAMRIVQGYSYHYGPRNNIRMSGMCGICYESTALPLQENDICLSLLCSGTRFMCKWPDDLMMVSLPFHMLKKTLDGIIATSNPCEPDHRKHIIKKRLKHPHDKHILLRSNYYSL